ncbi:MAG: tRNA uridine-5-carboxymethylaminomethyl(34) synthesis GTPase MnmE [Bacteroidota bacterium]|nr:tRNA uridine-5-carboxymethylaminomethyl(34) synthesis GTPase MnmE [Bacteroidota bacterium]
MSIGALNKDTIVALATPPGMGAIAVIRLSGDNAIAILETCFTTKQLKPKSLADKKANTIHFGVIYDGSVIIDEVLVSLFKTPHSYTGEDVIEVSCHGSQFIQQQLLQLFVKRGARMANAGEYTLRGFLNGKFDLSQAEAVADLIASNSTVSHQVAMSQMRGGFSSKIKILRENLVDFASLIELELDFSEEDVEFADRTELKNLIISIQRIIERLIESFEVGNVIKHGIPVAIVGKPNAGKSTLLNMLLQEDKAIVSEIPGTTRDTIEDEISIGGVLFRFIDTAGIRDTSDVIEQIGVNKALQAMQKSAIVIYLFDGHALSVKDIEVEIEKLQEHIGDSQVLVVCNKIDTEDLNSLQKEFEKIENIIYISAKEGLYIDDLKTKLVAMFDNRALNVTETVVTNVRHVEALRKANTALYRVMEGLSKNIQTDFLAMDIRYSLEALGEITGQVTTDDLLGNIFGKFCIGK